MDLVVRIALNATIVLLATLSGCLAEEHALETASSPGAAEEGNATGASHRGPNVRFTFQAAGVPTGHAILPGSGRMLAPDDTPNGSLALFFLNQSAGTPTPLTLHILQGDEERHAETGVPPLAFAIPATLGPYDLRIRSPTSLFAGEYSLDMHLWTAAPNGDATEG